MLQQTQTNKFTITLRRIFVKYKFSKFAPTEAEQRQIKRTITIIYSENTMN